MTSQGTTTFEIATWYDTWNQLGLDNLANKTVPLDYATRYNLAFGQLSSSAGTGYTVEMPGQFADEVKTQILTQAPGVVICAGLGDTGIAETVQDNNQNQNRSTKNIVAWLQDNGYSGTTLQRPELDRLRADAKARRFDRVLVHHPDRLARGKPFLRAIVTE